MTYRRGFGVLDKVAAKDTDASFDDFCGNIKRTNKSFPFNHSMNMMLHHQNHYHPFPSSESDGLLDSIGDGDHGPTISGDINTFITANNIYDVAPATGTATAGDAAGACVAAIAATGGCIRTLQQPLDLSLTEATTSAFNFKSPGGIMATSLEFPFTNSQWRELERQAMIYKYMVASVPVPAHLLMPTSINLPSGSDPFAAYHSSLGSGLNLRLAKGADLEPGRCRRTDGKKWRCSRDVAPDQKYCERHMHRGRPRSRKPVEPHARINNSIVDNDNNNNNNNKKSRYTPSTSTDFPVALAVSNPNIHNNAIASQFVGTATTSQTCIQTSAFLDKSSTEVSTFDATLASVSTHKQPRSLDWMMRGETAPVNTTDQQWHQLVQTEIGLATERFLNNVNASVLNQEGSLNLNSFGGFDVGEGQRRNQCLFLNETPRSFIDAWSNVTPEDNNPNTRNTGSIQSRGNLSHSSLTLTMGGTDSMDDEMDQTQMGLGLIESKKNQDCSTGTSASWTATTPGGPLAEVLQLSSAVTTTDQSSTLAENGDCGSPPTTIVSSPSGVLQKTVASFSDSSGNSSPTHGTS